MLIRNLSIGVLAVASFAAPAQIRTTLIENAKAWGSIVADFNRDGRDDIFITGHDRNDRIWYWSPTGYTPSPQLLDLERVDRHDCDAADVNLDGRLDFYCAIGAERGTGIKANELWMQSTNGSFVRVSGYGAEDPYGRSRRPVFFDMNHDGYSDIYVTSYSVPRPDGLPNINRVYLNQAGKVFAEANTLATGPNGHQCVAKGDINQDGWDDLVVCDGTGPGHLYLNNRVGDFGDLTSPARNAVWADAKLVDMNGDGRDDLVVITESRLFQIWLNSGEGVYFDSPAFEKRLPQLGFSLAAGDFNLDGLKDVYIVMRDFQCPDSGHDLAPDRVVWGRVGGGWAETALPQDYAGCGTLADVVEGSKVLVMNGGGSWIGPNYLLSFAP